MYENMRYHRSHELLEQHEKESLQGYFHQFELNELKILLFIHLEQLHQRLEADTFEEITQFKF